MSTRTENLVKNRTDDRVINLRPMEGKNTVSVLGLTDNRLFTGENKLHARKADQGDLWSLSYERGSVPGPLQQQFTTFTKCLKYVEDYFKRRNVEITGVEDV